MRVVGVKLPIILSKAKMQTNIENSTRISRNNRLVADTVFYNDNAGYFSVLIKYLVTKFRKSKETQVFRPKELLN